MGATNRACIHGHRLHAGGHVQAIGELARMVVVPAPTAAQHRLSAARQVIGHAESRLVK